MDALNLFLEYFSSSAGRDYNTQSFSLKGQARLGCFPLLKCELKAFEFSSWSHFRRTRICINQYLLAHRKTADRTMSGSRIKVLLKGHTAYISSTVMQASHAQKIDRNWKTYSHSFSVCVLCIHFWILREISAISDISDHGSVSTQRFATGHLASRLWCVGWSLGTKLRWSVCLSWVWAASGESF